jgi:hypothetical protein
MHLEELSGLGGDVDSAVRSTLGRHRSNELLKRVYLEDTNVRSAPGGYSSQADLTGTEVTPDRVSTVLLCWNDIAGEEDMW